MRMHKIGIRGLPVVVRPVRYVLYAGVWSWDVTGVTVRTSWDALQCSHRGLVAQRMTPENILTDCRISSVRAPGEGTCLDCCYGWDCQRPPCAWSQQFAEALAALALDRPPRRAPVPQLWRGSRASAKIPAGPQPPASSTPPIEEPRMLPRRLTLNIQLEPVAHGSQPGAYRSREICLRRMAAGTSSGLAISDVRAERTL